jgi:hypothetical protein
MQKQFLYICSIFCIHIAYSMELQTPHIVYNESIANSSLVKKLAEQYPDFSTNQKKKEILSHQSPEITRIHSDTYLHNLDNNTSSTLAAIYNSKSTWLCPNFYSKTYLSPLLDNVSATVATTECVLALHNSSQPKPHYAISLSEGNSFAKHDCGNRGDVYAPIPIAAAYALNKNNLKRILIIDENITLHTQKYYFNHGNGSIFFPKHNPELSALFENKIVIEKQMQEDMNDFFYNPQNSINLAFYNINVDDVERIEDMHPEDAKERKSKIYSLLYHLIPTIFILSGDKNRYEDMAHSLITYITDAAKKIAALSYLERFEQDIKNIKPKLIVSAQNFMAIFEKHRESLPIPSSFAEASADRSPTPSPTHSPRNRPTYSKSASSSSSCSDDEQERRRLRKKLNLAVSSSESATEDNYDAEESSSSHDGI